MQFRCYFSLAHSQRILLCSCLLPMFMFVFIYCGAIFCMSWYSCFCLAVIPNFQKHLYFLCGILHSSRDVSVMRHLSSWAISNQYTNSTHQTDCSWHRAMLLLEGTREQECRRRLDALIVLFDGRFDRKAVLLCKDQENFSTSRKLRRKSVRRQEAVRAKQ